ncbi:winged helix-turn-helix transcriptional regulator [Brevundimonas vancanneytii]|uniref:winged helix-turn-helix transcriptional regulator n=2 Tax=Brevundimonas TaxID=41275 RepID=UPI0034D5AF08
MGALKRLIPDISEKMLIQQLREMEADSLARPLRPGERLPEASPAQRRRYASDAREDAPHPRRGTLRIVLMSTHKWTFLQVQGQTSRRKPYQAKSQPRGGLHHLAVAA